MLPVYHALVTRLCSLTCGTLPRTFLNLIYNRIILSQFTKKPMDAETQNLPLPLPTPHCFNMHELLCASEQRDKVSQILQRLKSNHPLSSEEKEFATSPLFTHLSHGLALTTGSALGSLPPTTDQCLIAYQVPNNVGLSAGARAWTKHAHRSQELHPAKVSKAAKGEPGWWGRAQGPRAVLNEKALALFWRIVGAASWRNLHWLPHQVLVYEMRVPEGYGMRWSQDQSAKEGEEEESAVKERPWIFRGFVEPMIENGHEVGWRHPISPSPSSGSSAVGPSSPSPSTVFST